MLSVRNAGIHDLPVIQMLAHKIWPSAYGEILSPDQLTYMLDKIYSLSSLQHQVTVLHHHFILASDDNEPVAFASFSPEEDDALTFHLHKIYVSMHLQGTGAGKFLLRHIINSVREQKGTSIELNVNRNNKAKYFYGKLGFHIIKEADIDIGHGYFMNDFIMKLEL